MPPEPQWGETQWGGPPRSGTPPLDFGDVIDRGFRLWWRSIKAVLPVALILVLPSQVVSVLTSRRAGSFQNWMKSFQSQANNLNPGDTLDLSGLNGAVGGEMPALILMLITATLVQGVLTAYYTDRILMRETPIRDCLRSVLVLAPALIGAVILAGIANFLGLLACVIGVLFTMTRFAVAPQVVVVERADAIAALRRSWALTARRFWPLLGLIVVGGLISTLVSLPFSLISQSIGTGADGVGVLVQVLLGAFGTAMGTALTAAFMVFAYLDLRVRFENLDLGVIAAGAPQAP
jgi:hypothetical protein